MPLNHLHKQPRRLLLMFLLIMGVLWAYSITYCTIRLYENLTKLELNLPTTDLSNQDEARVLPKLPDLEDHLKIIKTELPRSKQYATTLYWLVRPAAPLLKVASKLPGLGPYAGQVFPLIDYTKNLSQAGMVLIPHAEEFLRLFQNEMTAATLIQKINNVLIKNQDVIRQASSHIEKAALAREKLDVSLLPHQVAESIRRIDKHFNQVEHFLDVSIMLPTALGSSEGGQSYLLLAQNRDELRATGGFISGIGRLEIDTGKVVAFDIEDSYDIDNFSKQYPAAPFPLQKFMLADYWLPRDANWSPDFPTAARQAQELITLSTGQASDGVIAFDQEAGRILLEALGPLNVASFPEPIQAENVEEMMQQAWSVPPSGEVSRDWWEQRKNFMPQLGRVILDELLHTSDKELLINLGRELVAAMKAGHILVYFNHEESQQALTNAELNNGIHPGEGDYLLVVDSNIGFNKVNSVIQRHITYIVELSNPQKPKAMLINQYHHTITGDTECVHESTYGTGVYKDLKKRCYWNYWRVYKPAGTGLYAANQTPVPGEWLLDGQDWGGRATMEPGINDTEVVSGLFVLPTDQSQDVVLQFALPPEVIVQTSEDNLVYNLKVHKQAGLDDLPVSLQVKPPQGYQLENPADPWRYDPSSGFWIWEGRVAMPERFELVFVEE